MPLNEVWCDESDLCEPCSDYTLDPSSLADFFEISSELLYRWTAMQFPGVGTETIRPCTQRTFQDYPGTHVGAGRLSSDYLYSPLGFPFGFPFSACGCGEIDTCGCGFLPQIRLPRWPIRTVSVKIDGAPFTSVRIDEDQFLVRTDGQQFPCCQDLSLPDTAPNTWSVSYTWGHGVPLSGRKAAAVLACELFLACQPDDVSAKCRLPRNIVSMTRQGISVQFADTKGFLISKLGSPIKTGLVEVDTFILAYNPHGLDAPCEIMSPDVPSLGRRVDTHYTDPPFGI